MVRWEVGMLVNRNQFRQGQQFWRSAKILARAPTFLLAGVRGSGRASCGWPNTNSPDRLSFCDAAYRNRSVLLRS